jgi:GH24 family phage-related lysozyme (muramidase)
MGEITNEAIQILKDHEDFRGYVYLDSEGHLTAGWGHKLSAEEREEYPKGYIFKESDRDILDTWFAEDAQKAYNAARDQVGQLKNPTQKLVDSFTSVNFQLGTSWYKDVKYTDKSGKEQVKRGFTNAWKAMKAGDFIKATKELFWANDTTHSKWYGSQSPDRVKDFARSLLTHSVTVDKREMFPDEHIMKEVIVNP